ncbi:MAG: bifunctional 4-hydroxy-2-oxoglutarate aldolase/2-dehydro-3-deoxy-phosphogluconate aldolase [Spirochaetes bacterium]|nr:bifunctional 4-hydroxy-2-oxoglutarate aldolase/2-dehydro-3-deoxy-phosphogluconate aldolase [Spirochaetota bacterium]
MDFTVIGIARGLNKDEIIASFEAVIKGGINNLEITMNSKDADKIIKDSVAHFKNRALIGAGTVITMEEMDRALIAGAGFIVSPVLNIEMVRYLSKNKIPVYPGAFSPTEIYSAWDAGATMVKVFPVSRAGGAFYIKDVKAPLDTIKLLACGGVTLDNLKDYIECGTDGIALGNQLFDKTYIKNRDYVKLTQRAEEYIKILKETFNK